MTTSSTAHRVIAAVLGTAVWSGCVVGDTSTEPDETNSDPEPEGSPPAAPAIRNLIPVVGDEPLRGISVDIADQSNNEAGFTLQRKSSGGSYAVVASLGANPTSYDDWGLDASIEYTYRVRAHNSHGTSSWSQERSALAPGPQMTSLSTYTTADAFVQATSPNTNFGSHEYVTVAGDSGYWGGRAHGLLAFDLPAIPSYFTDWGASNLRLCEAGGGNTSYPGSIEIRAVPLVGQWSEQSVTWATRPGSWLSTSGTASHNPNQDTCVLIDVTDVVLEWYAGVRSNLGFMLYSGSEAYVAYYSKEGLQSGSALLVIGYYW